ncbi:SGNH/GDSL hydrolase family protein [Fibrobacterota bacterium]
MKKLIFIGDDLSLGKNGYGELVRSHLLLLEPGSENEVIFFSDNEMTYEKAFSQLPLHVIGKAPEVVVLALGHHDLVIRGSLEDMVNPLTETINLILDKTQASVLVVNLCSPFFVGNEQVYARCKDFNRVCAEISNNNRVCQVDIDTPAEEFLSEHRLSKGEKMSLHAEGPRLTILGALLISRTVAEKISMTFSPETGNRSN